MSLPNEIQISKGRGLVMMRRIKGTKHTLGAWVAVLPATLALSTTASVAEAQWIYWTVKFTSTIQRAHLDGSGLQTFETGCEGDIRRFALDVDGDFLYWGDQINGIKRSDVHGRNVVVLIDAASKGIAIDREHRKIYWCGGGVIHRADLDGSNVEIVLDPDGSTEGLALDIRHNYVYWTDWTNGYVRRWQLDSAMHVENLVPTEPAGPEGIALDIARQRMYWADEGSIRCANLDGTAARVLVPDTYANGIALDLDAGKMYWTIEGAVERANLDGSNVETVLEGLGYANDIALDLRPNVITSFTYQGQLKHHGRPVDALCDFQFSLWDDPEEGAAISATLSSSDVSVASGLFAVELDFGGAVFDGTKRWLELAVRCPDGPHDFTVLTPRQPITPTPYAQFSLAAPAFHPVNSTASACLAIDADVRLLREEVNELTARLRRVEEAVAQRDDQTRNEMPR
jgi:sugar lactone lactonase YvrE